MKPSYWQTIFKKESVKNQEDKTQFITYFLGLFIACIGILYGNAIREEHTFLRIWEFENLLYLAIGLPFIYLTSFVGIPSFWDKQVSNFRRWTLPLLIGSVFGIADIFVIKVLMHPEPYTSLPPFLQPFPYSLFLFFSGALEIEVFYRLIPLTLFLPAGKYFAQGKYFSIIFWFGAILTAIREPLEQFPDGSMLFVAYSLFTGFAMNFLQAIAFRQSGFLASLAIRLGHYLFWHILLGVYVEFFELP